MIYYPKIVQALEPKCRTNVGVVSIDQYCSKSCCYEVKDK